MDKKMTLGGFEAVLDSFIPNPDGGFRNSNVDENVNVNADEFESLDDEELEDIKNNNIEVKNKKEKPVEEQDTEEEEIEEAEVVAQSERQPRRPTKDETIEGETEEQGESEDNNEEDGVTNFLEAMDEKRSWEL